MVIIFDCDGVLRSISWEGLYQAYIARLEAAGKKHTNFFSDIDNFKIWREENHDWRESDKKFGIDGIDANTAERIDKVFRDVYNKHISLFDWVPQTLSELSCRHKLTLLSSASEHSVKESLGDTAKYFNCLLGCEHVKNLKPHPEGIHLIMENYPGISKEDFIMIGDTVADIQAGKNAGIKTGAVNWGMGKKDELLALSPDKFFDNPEELLEL